MSDEDLAELAFKVGAATGMVSKLNGGEVTEDQKKEDLLLLEKILIQCFMTLCPRIAETTSMH